MQLDSGQWEETAQVLAETCSAVEAATKTLWVSSAGYDPATAAGALRSAGERLSAFIETRGGENARLLGGTMERELRSATSKIVQELERIATEVAGLVSPSRRTPPRLTAISEGLRAQQTRLNLLEDWARVAETTTESIDRALARHFDSHTTTSSSATRVVFDVQMWQEVLASGASLKDHVQDSMKITREKLKSLPEDVQGYRSAVDTSFDSLERFAASFRSEVVRLAENFGPCTWAAAASRLRWLTGQVTGVRQALVDLPERENGVSALQLISVIERELGVNVDELLRDIEEGMETVRHTIDTLENALVEDVELNSKEPSTP